jgi:hypothetical protein
LFVPTSYPDRPERSFWWDRVYLAVTSAPPAAFEDLPWRIPSSDTPKHRSQLYARLVAWLKQRPHQDAMEYVERLVQQANVTPKSHVLGWSELRRLAKEGLAIGCHTQTHPLLPRVSTDQAAEEICGSLAALRKEIGDAPPILAYPGGKFTASCVDAARSAGVQAAFASRRGINDMAACDPLRIRRNNIGLGTSHAVFRARLLTWSRHLNRWRPVNGR